MKANRLRLLNMQGQLLYTRGTAKHQYCSARWINRITSRYLYVGTGTPLGTGVKKVVVE